MMNLWIDCETTGLRPFKGDRILEIGWFIADEIEPVTEPQSVLITPDHVAWDIIKQDSFIHMMHTNNNLLNDIDSFGTLMIEDAEDLILKDLDKFEIHKPILAGSSVHFDRAFIYTWMPRLDKRLSHRHFDVSVLKMFFDSEGLKYLGEREHDTAHRAISDIEDSFTLYKRYSDLVEQLVGIGEGDN
jgi:oligoribonuclease